MPDGEGYIAAAYIVFLAIVLIYVGIMATRLSRLERELSELNDLAARSADRPEAGRERVESTA